MARKSYSEKEKQTVRETLLKVMIQCIAEKGLFHTSVDFLCKSAGISKNFFYSLFDSKEALVLEALQYQQLGLLRYAQSLMDDSDRSWRESAKTFLHNCCYGAKHGIAALSLEEEQEICRCLTPESFQTFQQNQINFYGKLLSVLRVSASRMDPRFFGNIALSTIMIHKAIPDSMPFLFAELADETMEFQINALLDEMERAKTVCYAE